MSELNLDSKTEFQERVFHSQVLTGKVFVVDCGCPYGDEAEENGQAVAEEEPLACALEFGNELARHGARVIYTRSRLAEVSIQERIIIANKYPQASALISWRNGQPGAQGFKVTVQKDEGAAGQLAKAIVQGMSAQGVKLQDSGIVEAAGVKILQKTVMPAILTEADDPVGQVNSGLPGTARQKLIQTHIQAFLKVFGDRVVTGPGYTYRKMRFSGTDVHLVVLKSPMLIVATAPTGTLETTSALAALHKGKVAINGGFVQDTGPATPVVIDHQIADHGIDLPAPRAALGILDDGSMEIIRAQRSQELLGFRYALGAGPQLVSGGKVQVSEEKFPPDIITGPAPRAAAGLVDSRTLLLAVADGSSPQDRGLSLAEMGVFLVARGAVTAMNLAGGAFATLVVGGGVKNNPSDGRERPVANALVML